MRFTIPQKPHPRDVLIYQEVVCEKVSQTYVAQAHGLSQSQVSRICRRMKEYLVLARPLEDRLSVAQAEWLVQQEYVEQLAFVQRQAIEAFKNGIEYGPHVTVIKNGPAGDQRGKTTTRRPGQADPRMLRIYHDVATKLLDARLEEVRMADKLTKDLTKEQPGWTEDWNVTCVLRHINDLRRKAVRMRRAGFVAVKLPEFKQAEVVAQVRRNCRENPEQAGVVALLPEEWLTVYRAIHLDVAPLDRLPAEELARQRRPGRAYPWEDFCFAGPEYASEERALTGREPATCDDADGAPGMPGEGAKGMHSPAPADAPRPLARSA